MFHIDNLVRQKMEVNFGQKTGDNNRNLLEYVVLNGDYGNKRGSGCR
jgi:hypothetical protein